ncbi:MAG: TlpA family protein disulfide reductase, partial [Chitinophagales bacterium]
KKVPDISCEGMIGSCVPLESLQGKMVLIEFWSSTNHSSMLDHAELEKIYNDYKDASFKNGDGFEVYSIALDNSEEKWQLAKIRDNNSWSYSMCNPQKWNAQVAMDYQIQTIPKYFLLNGDGELVENLFMMKDLRLILSRYSQKAR